jgi:hypothetical protein
MPIVEIPGIGEVEFPDGMSQTDILQAIQNDILPTYRPPIPEPVAIEAPPPKQSGLRQIADIPLKTSSGVVKGVRFLADAFGADNPVSQSLRGAEDYIADLYSAQSKADSQRIAEIMKEAEDKGVGAQLKAALEAISVAPVDFVSEALGTAAPTIATGLLGTAARLGALGVRGAQAATGAGMGAGVVKSSIYDAVKDELGKTDMPAEQVEARAQLAQSYGGENLDMILGGVALGGIAATTGIDPRLARSAAAKILGREAGEIGAEQTARGVGRRAVETAAAEAVPEAAQGAQEQLAQNIALQREGFDVPTTRGVVGAGALEGLVGAGLGAGVGAITQDPAAAAQARRAAEQAEALKQINAERARQQGVVDTAQAEQAQREAEVAAREASLRTPLTEQMELDLAPETTIEEVAAQRASQSPQGDLFTTPPSATPQAVTEPAIEAPPVETKPTLDTETIDSFGLSKSSRLYKTLKENEGSDLSDPAQADFVKNVINASLETYKGKFNEPAINTFLGRLTLETPDALPNVRDQVKQSMLDSGVEFKNPAQVKKFVRDELGTDTLTSLEASNAKIFKEMLDEYKQVKSGLEPETSGTGVQVPVQRGNIPAPRAAGPVESGLDDAGPTVGQRDVGERVEPGPLEALEVEARPTIEDRVAELPPETKARMEQAGLIPAAAPVQPDVTPQPTAQPEQTLTPAQRAQQRVIEQRRLEEEQRKAEREQARQEALAEQRTMRTTETVLPEGEREGLAAVKEAEVTDDEVEFNTAKDTLGAYLRQTVGGVKNIAPDDIVTGAQAMDALVEIMYYIIKDGARNVGEAIAKARQLIGPDNQQFTQDDMRLAYNNAQRQLKSEQSASAPAPVVGASKEQKLDATLARAGGNPRALDSPSAPFQSLRDDPKNYVKEKYSGMQGFLDNLETKWFSSDAKLSKSIRRGMERAGKSWEDMRKVLYAITTSQTLHGENVAHNVLELGNIVFDPETNKYMAVSDPNGSWKAAIDTINEAAKANGIEPEKMQRYAHQAFVARRLRALQERNQEIDQQVAKLAFEGKKDEAEAARKRKVLIHLTDAEIDAGLDFFNEIPELNTAFEQWNVTRENLINFAVDTGLYSRENADTLLDNMDYVPFYRVEQIDAQAGPREYSGGLLDASKDKRLVGSRQEVNNVFDNMERWISYTVRKGINNKAAQNLTNFSLEFLPDEVRPVTEVGRGRRGNTIGIWENGERKLYEFDDPFYIDAFTGLESVALPGLKALTTMSNILRQNIVLNPLFSLSQLPQDAFGAMFSSGVKNPFAIPLQVMTEFAKTLTGTSEAHNELMRYGATGQRDYSAAMSRIDAETAEGLRKPKAWEKALAPLRKIATASDNAVRQAIYKQTLKETGDKALAVERAFEVINFRRGGSSPYVSIGRQVVPFFGAYLQAMNVVTKTLTARGIAPSERAEALRVWTNTIPKVMMLSLLYAMLIGEDEDFKDDDPVSRARKLYIPGSGGLTIPLRPDLFTFISKVIPEQLYMNMTDEMTMDGTKTRLALRDALVDAVAGPTAVPQAIKPIIEVALNRNFFTGRNLVGQGLQYLDKPEQYAFNTSELAKLMGQTGVVSPIAADHILRSYFGYTGGLFLMGTDAAINAGSDVQKPTMPTQDFIASIPGMSPFVTREFGAKQKNEFYELREKVNKAVNTYNRISENDRERAKEYQDENKELLRVKSQVNRINKLLTDIRTQERKIRNMPESRMTAEQKEERVRQLRMQEQRILKNLGVIRQRAGL